MNLYAVAATALFGLLTMIGGWVQRYQAQQTGMTLATAQIGAASATAAATAQAAIAQAEVAAPATRLAVVDRLKAGTY